MSKNKKDLIVWLNRNVYVYNPKEAFLYQNSVLIYKIKRHAMYKKIDDLARILCNVILCKDNSDHEALEVF